MVIAALISFAVLLVAWILAPNEGSSRPTASVQEPEALPIAA